MQRVHKSTASKHRGGKNNENIIHSKCLLQIFINQVFVLHEAANILKFTLNWFLVASLIKANSLDFMCMETDEKSHSEV